MSRLLLPFNTIQHKIILVFRSFLWYKIAIFVRKTIFTISGRRIMMPELLSKKLWCKERKVVSVLPLIICRNDCSWIIESCANSIIVDTVPWSVESSRVPSSFSPHNFYAPLPLRRLLPARSQCTLDCWRIIIHSSLTIYELSTQ